MSSSVTTSFFTFFLQPRGKKVARRQIFVLPARACSNALWKLRASQSALFDVVLESRKRKISAWPRRLLEQVRHILFPCFSCLPAFPSNNIAFPEKFKTFFFVPLCSEFLRGLNRGLCEACDNETTELNTNCCKMIHLCQFASVCNLTIVD